MSDKKRITSGIESMIWQSSKWYHDSTQWCEDSWKPGFSCNDLIKIEMNLVDAAYDDLIKEHDLKVQTIKDLQDYINNKPTLNTNPIGVK